MPKYKRQPREIKRVNKRFKAVLNAEPDMCILRTATAAYRIHKTLFPQLFYLGAPAVIRLGARIAEVATGFTLCETERGEWFFQRIDTGDRTPSIRTNASAMLDYAKYDVRGLPGEALKEKRQRVIAERDREFVKQYGIFLNFARV